MMHDYDISMWTKDLLTKQDIEATEAWQLLLACYTLFFRQRVCTRTPPGRTKRPIKRKTGALTPTRHLFFFFSGRSIAF